MKLSASDLENVIEVRLINEACGNPVLLEICSRLWNMSELYRSWSVSHDKKRLVAAGHKALMQAAINRKTDLTVALFNEHIKHTVDALIEKNSL